MLCAVEEGRWFHVCAYVYEGVLADSSALVEALNTFKRKSNGIYS